MVCRFWRGLGFVCLFVLGVLVGWLFFCWVGWFGFDFVFCKIINVSTHRLQQFEFSQLFLPNLLHSWDTVGTLNILGMKTNMNFWAQLF